MNLDAVLRIAAKVTGTDAVLQLNRALGGAERAAGAARAAFKDVIKSAAWQGAAAAAAGIGVALGTSVKAAIDFESAVADVRKVMGELDATGVKEIRGEILGLSREMPITAQGFAQIYAAGASSGIARNEIRAFAQDVARVSVAFEITAEDSARALATLRAALGLTQPEVVSLADAINYLANNMGANERQLVDFTQRTAAMGRLAGLTGEQTAAFGSAMISMGVETEIAATSFNNLVRNLSRGASMTARQESALMRLGLASRTVASGERELTAAIQRGSDRRLEIIQDESDRQQNELRKRYRRQLQLLEDQSEDEFDEFEDQLRDRQEAEIKGLQRQADARIKALQKQAGDNDEWLDRQTDAVRDQLDREIDAIRDHDDRILKQEQRARRDERQAARDAMDERMDDELKGIERINKQRVEAEKAGTKEALDAAKAVAEQGGSEAGRNLAKRLQDDALGTIRDVFKRIRGLAAEEQISVITDLFGDEARGLAPLISNMGQLEMALGLVGDKTKYAGSMQREYEQRAATTANRIQLLKNNVGALQIQIGEGLAPVLDRANAALVPVIAAVDQWMQKNPALAAGVSMVAAALAGFVAVLPVVSSIATILAVPGLLAGLGAMAAAFAVIAVKVGIVVAAVGLLALAFTRAWQSFEWFRNGITTGLAGIVEGWQGAFTLIKGFLAGDSDLITKGWNMMIEGIKKATVAGFQFTMKVIGETSKWLLDQILAMPGRLAAGARAIGVAIGNGIAAAVRSIFGGMLRWMADRINWMANQINRLIRTINSTTGSNLGQLGMITVPAFAQGGYVTGPTLGMVGEAGREYIVPEGKAAGFANNIMAGRRGASAIPSGSSSSNSAASVTVNLTTGPVMQDQSGQRWMTIEDGERMARQTAEQVLRISRTPGGRYAAGVR